AVALLPVPQPDRRREIFEARHDTDESVRLLRIVRRAQLEHHLILGAELQDLAMPALLQIPDVQRVAVLARKQHLGIDAGLDHVGRPPLAGDQRVVPEMPPEVVRAILRSAILLPWTADLERVRLEDEDAARSVAVGRSDRVHINAVGTAMRGVRTRITRPL